MHLVCHATETCQRLQWKQFDLYLFMRYDLFLLQYLKGGMTVHVFRLEWLFVQYCGLMLNIV